MPESTDRTQCSRMLIPDFIEHFPLIQSQILQLVPEEAMRRGFRLLAVAQSETNDGTKETPECGVRATPGCPRTRENRKIISSELQNCLPEIYELRSKGFVRTFETFRDR